MKFMVCATGNDKELGFLPVVSDMGLGIELQSYGLKGTKSEMSWQQVFRNHLRIKKAFSGPVAVHGPFLGIQYNYEDHYLRTAVEKRMDDTFSIVQQLKPATLVLHTGFNDDVKKFHLETSWLEQTVQFWAKEIRRYEELGVIVVLENVLESDPTLMIRLVETVASDNLRLCLDIGHVNIWSELSPVTWIEQMGSSLHHVHIHDNSGDMDSHLPLGEGQINFEPVFESLQKINPDVNVSFEINSPPETVVANIAKVLSGLKYQI